MSAGEKEVKKAVMDNLSHKICKYLKVLQTDPTKLKEPQSTIKIKEYLCLLIKAMEDALKKVPEGELVQTVMTHKL